MHDRIIRAALFTPGTRGRWGLPIILQGPPGTAKSCKTENIAAETGLPCEVVIASLREPADFLGLPIPLDISAAHKAAVGYAPPSWALRAAEAGRGVVFLDEINTAPPAVQAALLRVVLEGVVGDLQLPRAVRFMAAMNSVEEAAGGWDLAAPLANRLGHLPWGGPGIEEWSDWLLGGANGGPAQGGDAEAEEERVREAWPSPWARARGLVSGFLRRSTDLLHKQPPAGSPQASGAWPSRRSWEMATRALAGAEVHGLSATEGETFMACFVGEGAASQFEAWRAQQDLPDPAELLDGKVKFKHDPRRLDRSMAVLTSCAALVAPQDSQKRVARTQALWKIIGLVAKDATDLVIPAAKTLARAKLLMAAPQDSVEVMDKHLYPALKAAGLIDG